MSLIVAKFLPKGWVIYSFTLLLDHGKDKDTLLCSRENDHTVFWVENKTTKHISSCMSSSKLACKNEIINISSFKI